MSTTAISLLKGAFMSRERWLIPVLMVAALAGAVVAIVWPDWWSFVCLGLVVCCVALGGLGLHLAAEHRQTGQNLESALRFQQEILDKIPIPVFYKSEKGVYLGCNSSFEQFMGMERRCIIGRTAFDIASRELARIYQEQDAALLARPGVQIYECEVEGKGMQTRRHVIFHKATFEDPGGQIRGIIGGILDITDRKEAEMEKDRVIDELQQALDNVKLLSDMLPICSHCKKIRDDKGYWNQIEAYLQTHTGAQFSHGICPDCTMKLYAEYYPDSDDPGKLSVPESGQPFMQDDDSLARR